MDVPNHLIVELHDNYVEQYKGYIERRGGKWEEYGKGKYKIIFPEDTVITRVYQARENYQQIWMNFADDGYFVWHRVKDHEGRMKNAMNIPRDAYEAVGEVCPPPKPFPLFRDAWNFS